MSSEDIISVIVALVLLIPIMVIAFVVSFYGAAYSVALLHILFVDPTIFDTYSLFTIPYNEVWIMATKYWWYWVLAIVYFIVLVTKSNKKCPYK